MTEAMENEFMSRILAAIESRPIQAIPVDVALWSVKQVASYLNRAESVVRARIAPLPGFPKAIRLPAEGGSGRPLYKASEVIAWAETHREKR